jgi:L-2-aminoadipate reductase
VDVVIHNGAVVHWVLDYSTLRAPNVLSTIELIKFCAWNKFKSMVFISSTSVLDTDYYLNPANIPPEGLPESDSLAHSAKRLATGYGQTKWVSEALMRDASDRGLQGVILRPGYVTGHSIRGTTITDDFLVRILKGCIQLGFFPELGDDNFINMMPVDGVAEACVAAALQPPRPNVAVLNAVSRTMTFNAYLFSLQRLGYNVIYTRYDNWRAKLQQYVASSAGGNGEEHALLPLYHLAVSDLPADSRSPNLSVANAKAVLAAEPQKPKARFEVTDEILKRYFAYLIDVGFLPQPEELEVELPKIQLSEERRAALSKIGGRGKI